MRELFRGCNELAELVLRIIAYKNDLIITETKTQYDLHKLAGAHTYMARYHSSLIDVEYLKEGDKFTALPITYVIFITENDVWGREKPVYHFKWYDKVFPLLYSKGFPSM